MTASVDRRRFLGLLGGLALLGVPLVGACAAQPTVQPKAPAQVGQTSGQVGAVTVEMNDQNKFVPELVTIKKGGTVTWKNVGTMVHNVSTDATMAADKAHAAIPSTAKPFTSPMLNGGQSFAHTFDVAGEYTYFCQPHEALGMVGRVVVTE
jgi:plastocyanin